MASVGNVNVKISADSSGMKRGISDANRALKGFQSSARSSLKSSVDGMKQMSSNSQSAMGAMSSSLSIAKGAWAALALAAVTAFTVIAKKSVQSAIEYEASLQRVTYLFGKNQADILKWANTQAIAFNMSRGEAVKYSAVYGNLLATITNDSGKLTQYTTDLLKASAIVASATGREMNDVMERIRSGLLGNTEAIEDLGISIYVNMIESTKAFQQFANGKSWDQLDFRTQQQIRLFAILEQVSTKFGDSVYNNTNSALLQLNARLSNVKLNLGEAFLPLVNIVIPILTRFAQSLEAASLSFKNFMLALFGKKEEQKQALKATSQATDAQKNLGKAVKEAGADAKNGIASFDEVNQLQEAMASSAEDAAGAVSEVAPQTQNKANIEMPDTSAIDDFRKNIQDLQTTISDFYNNWGIKDIFEGIKRGAGNFDFTLLKQSVKSIGFDLVSILNESEPSVKAASKSLGEAIGTSLEEGINTYLKVVETVGAGVEKFFAEKSPRISSFVKILSGNMETTFKDFETYIADVFKTINGSLDTNKPLIASAIASIMSTVLILGITVGTVVSSMLSIVMSSMKDFLKDNQLSMANFLNNTIKIVMNSLIVVATITSDILESIQKFWDNWGKDIFKGVVGIFLDVAKWFLDFYNQLLIPIFNRALAWIYKIWQDNLKGVVDELLGFIGRIGKIVLLVYDYFIKPMIQYFMDNWLPFIKQAIVDTIDLFGNLLNGIIGVVKNVLKILNGFLDIIVGVFTEDWKKAWEGVKEVFTGIFSGIWEVVKAVVNSIITMINRAIDGLNQIKIPDWVPVYGGKNLNIDRINYIGGEKLQLPSDKQNDAKVKLTKGTLDEKSLGLDKFNLKPIDTSKLNALMKNNVKEQNAPEIKYTSKSLEDLSKTFIMPNLKSLDTSNQSNTPTINGSYNNDSLIASLASVLKDAILFNNNTAQNQGSVQANINIDGSKLAQALIPLIRNEQSRIGNAIIQGV